MCKASYLTYHILFLKVLLLVPSNSCHHQGENTLHNADAVTARALVVLNRWEIAHGVKDFLFEVVGFVWSFFGMPVMGSCQALEDGSPPR